MVDGGESSTGSRGGEEKSEARGLHEWYISTPLGSELITNHLELRVFL